MFHVKHPGNKNKLFHVKHMHYICNDCPRRCGAERGETGRGACRMGAEPVVARAALHFDEEPVISGTRGSGTVFFSGCALGCIFCQNGVISHENFGKQISVGTLKKIYRDLIAQGAQNINLVNPSHFSRAILESLEEKLPVPVVYNTGGYDSVETLKQFEGKVQVYLPDLKYVSRDLSARYSKAPDYFEAATAAITEMLRQTGSVEIDEDGRMVRGVMIRHLVLPGCAEDSMRVLDWIAEYAKGAWVSLMAQYTPMGADVDDLSRRVFPREYRKVVRHLEKLGLEDGFCQELESGDEKYIPGFDLTGVPDEE